MAVEMKIHKEKLSPAEEHAREVDRLKLQCDVCRLYKPNNVHGGCEVRYKLVSQDSPVAWKNRHLFFRDNGDCKMFSPKVTRSL